MKALTAPLVLTSRVGTFIFPPGTSLVDAKAVRDAVMGRWFNPAKHEPLLMTREDCKKYVKSINNRIAQLSYGFAVSEDAALHALLLLADRNKQFGRFLESLR